MQKPKIIIVVGPTASGKTALSISLAKKFCGEIISADSRQVYRGLDIGTGKVTKKEMMGVPHHLLDVASPSRVYTAQHFIRNGRKAIADILKRGKLPIIAGGTGFYIDALVGNIVLPKVKPDNILRAKLEKKSLKVLVALLVKKDPVRAKNIDTKNKVRIVRALEIAYALGKNPPPQKEELYDTLWIGIAPDSKSYRKNIHGRLFARMKQGMLAEAKRLREQGLSHKRMEALGLEYRYLSRFLRGTLTKSELLEILEKEINRYAKRQMKYWKRNKEIRWFGVRDRKVVKKLVSEHIAN